MKLKVGWLKGIFLGIAVGTSTAVQLYINEISALKDITTKEYI